MLQCNIGIQINIIKRTHSNKTGLTASISQSISEKRCFAMRFLILILLNQAKGCLQHSGQLTKKLPSYRSAFKPTLHKEV